MLFDSGLPIARHLLRPADDCTSSSAAGSSPSDQKEFGRAFIEIVAPSALFDGLWKVGEKHQVWMSHGDRVETPRAGLRGRRQLRRRAVRDRHQRGRGATTPDVPPRGRAHARRRQAARQFRPPRLRLRRRLDDGRASATPRSPRSASRSATGRVICGLSGGVDSAVAAVLIHEAIGEQLTCVFVDHGLMRAGRGGAGRLAVPQQLQHPAGPCGRRAALPRRARRASPTPKPSASSSARPSSTCSRPRRRRSAAPTSSRRARSIPT